MSELVERLDVTQSAVSQHLRVLRDAGLARAHRDGKRRIYRVDATPLQEVATWVAAYERFWRGKLGAVGAYLESQE